MRIVKLCILLLLVTQTTAREGKASFLIGRQKSLNNRRLHQEHSGSIYDDISLTLLIPRRVSFEWIFILNHVIALLRCISTIGVPFARVVSDQNIDLQAFTINIVPHQFLPAIGALFQGSISLCCHYGYMILLSRRPWIKKLMKFSETKNLKRATAVYITESEIDRNYDSTSNGEMIVSLRPSSIISVDKCLELLKVIPDRSSLRTQREEAMFVTNADTSEVIARQFECNDLNFFLFQSRQEISRSTRINHGKVEMKRKKIENSRSKKERCKLEIYAARPHYEISLQAAQRANLDSMQLDGKEMGPNSNTSTNIKSQNHFSMGLTTVAATSRISVFGANSCVLSLPSLRQKILRHFFSPINMLQMLFQFMSILEEPIHAPITRIALTIFSDSCAIMRELESAKMLNKEASSNFTENSSSIYSSTGSIVKAKLDTSYTCRVLRNGNIQKISIEIIVPGDILYLTDGIIPADCLLLEGSCVVNEATQTGEAVPLSKIPISSLQLSKGSYHIQHKLNNDSETYLSFLEHQSNILLSGTELLQIPQLQNLPESDGTEKEATSKSYVKCLVLRTGFGSSEGKLLRKMKTLGHRVSGKGRGLLSDQQEGDLFRLLAILTSTSIITSLYLYFHGMAIKYGRYRLYVQIARIIVSMASPDIMKDITFTIAAGARRLTREEEVYCMDPAKLTRAGLVTACLFDKTGTISTDVVVADKAITPISCDIIHIISENLKNDTKSNITNLMVNKDCRLESNCILNMSFKGDTWSTEEWDLSSSPLGLQIVAACCHSLMELFPCKDAGYVSYRTPSCNSEFTVES